MTRRAFLSQVGAVALVAAALLIPGAVDGRCHGWHCHARPTPSPLSTPRPTLTAVPTAAPTAVPSPTPTPSPTVAPTAAASPSASAPTYTFDDEFSGLALSPVWIRHFSCCGTLAGYDPALATVSGGYLHLSVVQRSSGWWGYLLDTKTTFTQAFGYFEARIRIPKGAGLWPAFWMYLSGTPEIDTMEVCANPLGTNGGNDASLLHTTVHYGTGQQLGKATRTADLSLAFHVYAVDWRSSAIRFYLDGSLVWTYTGPIPAIALPLVLNLGIGGSWCGAAGTGGTMLVDYVRVRP